MDSNVIEIGMLEIMEDFVVVASTFIAIILPCTCLHSGITIIFAVSPGTTKYTTFCLCQIINLLLFTLCPPFATVCQTTARQDTTILGLKFVILFTNWAGSKLFPSQLHPRFNCLCDHCLNLDDAHLRGPMTQPLERHELLTTWLHVALGFMYLLHKSSQHCCTVSLFLRLRDLGVCSSKS